MEPFPGEELAGGLHPSELPEGAAPALPQRTGRGGVVAMMCISWGWQISGTALMAAVLQDPAVCPHHPETPHLGDITSGDLGSFTQRGTSAGSPAVHFHVAWRAAPLGCS